MPAARVVPLARYADQAWATQLADLAPPRRIATLAACTHLLAASARDDVIDIFDASMTRMPAAAEGPEVTARPRVLRPPITVTGRLGSTAGSLTSSLPEILPGPVSGADKEAMVVYPRLGPAPPLAGRIIGRADE